MQTHGPREPEPTAEDLEIARLVGSTPVPSASTEAREAARSAFLEGHRVSVAPTIVAVPARRTSRRLIGSLALAASLAGALWFGVRPTEAWHVARIEGGGTALVDGSAVRVGDSFAAGVVAAGEDCELHLEFGDRLCICLPPGSRVRVPEGPRRWGSPPRLVEIETGDVFASSGDRKLGFDLVVATEDARIRIVGTTFAVRLNEAGTCICLLHGDVEIEPIEAGSDETAPTLRVPRGQRLQVFADGRDPMVMSLDPAEVTMLESLYDAGLTLGAPASPPS